ncbi:hypothetical protein [Pseudomonas bohemica]|uniref:hypothetical protein n=1 Tax=Pseudomonas bohemica TaxID=2044872 RepID=UPI000DA5F5AB|nr:hypothetical protein [Pseudomonas bohemica]
MLRKSDWTLSSVASMVFGLLTAWFWWWLIIYQGMWPYIIFSWVPAVPGLAFGIYALRIYKNRVAVLAIMLTLSPLAPWAVT